MPELQKGTTFSDGMVVNAATLNNLVDLGIALEGLISDKTDTTPAADDYVLFWKSGTLFKCKFSEIPSAVTSVGLAMPSNEFTVTGSPVTTSGTLTTTWKNQPGNKFFAGNGTGGGGTPSFRLIGSEDLALASVEVAANTVDWSLGNLFHKTITTGFTGFAFTNKQDGQTIKLMVGQDASGGHTYPWPAGIWWQGAAFPVESTAPFAVDIFTFTCYGTGIFGKGDLNYKVI